MTSERGRVLTVLAVLYGVLALTNLTKFLPLTDDTGFVFFGQRLAGAANTLAGLVAGTILVMYATGIWRMRRWALPLGWGYAAYVAANIVLFRVRYPMPAASGQQVFEVTYAAVAIGVSLGTALLLGQRRADLR